MLRFLSVLVIYFITICMSVHIYAADSFPFRIPAESIEFHELMRLPHHSNIDIRAIFSGTGQLRLFSTSFSVYTSDTAEGMYIPYEGHFHKVDAISRNAIVLNLDPVESIPEGRRILPGCFVLTEKSGCNLYHDEFFFRHLPTDKKELRCEVYDGKAMKKLPQTYGVGDAIELTNGNILIKRILPAEKNFPAWVEFEYKAKEIIKR
jgi:hypothetical protein